jgi:hypothetical protein
MGKKGWLVLMLWGFLALDSVYTFLQHRQIALDGDLSSLVLPSPYYEPVLDSPFGWDAVTGEEAYASPNRFFVHWAMCHYYRKGPQWLGALTDTVEGIYLSSALLKTGAHLLLLALLSWLVSRKGNGWDWLLAAVLLVPLFQSAGAYQPVMGMVEPSPTYTFFYAWPSVLMLGLVVLLVKFWEQREGALLLWEAILFIGLMVILPFTGPIVPGVIVLSLGVFGLGNIAYGVRWGKAAWRQRFGRRLPLLYWVGLCVLGALGIYSLYLGTLSTEQQESVSISARYLRLPEGIWKMLTNKPALPLLLVGLLWHYFQLSRRPAEFGYWMKKEGRYLLLFALLYLLMLPLGGYRDYRPDIVRRDTVQPVLMVLFYLWGRSGLVLFRNKGLSLWAKLPSVLLLLLFTIVDFTAVNEPSCERLTMEQLASAKQDTIVLDRDCPILTWRQIPNQDTRPPSELLVLWGVLGEGQHFVYKKEE